MKYILTDIKFNRWWTLPVIIFFLTIWVFISVCSAQATIILKDQATVPGPKFTLGDIADISCDVVDIKVKLENIKLGIAPLPTIPIKLSRRTIEFRIKENQFDLTQLNIGGAQKTVVSLDTIIVSGMQALKTAKEYLENNINVPGGSYDIKFMRTPNPLPAPRRGFSMKVHSGRNIKLKGPFTLKVGVFCDGKLFRSIPVNVRVKTYEYMIIAANAIPRGKVITEDDIILTIDETTTFNKNLIRDKNLAIGKEAKIAIRADSPIFENNLQSPVIIKRGDLVNIKVKRGSVIVSCKGTAKNDGRLGDTIKVRRIDKPIDYIAVVVSSTTVEIR